MARLTIKKYKNNNSKNNDEARHLLPERKHRGPLR